MKIIVGKNDLATTHPELAKEAVGWDPNTVIAGTHKKLEWKCKKGHTWKAAGSTRVKGHGCPFCSGRQVLVGVNDLATTHPDLASEAFGWDPKTVIAGTRKKLDWKCKQGHTWKANGSDRAYGKSGCPICSGRQVLVGVNDLATTHPDLASEAFGWDPKFISAGTGKKVEWKCKQGHTWKATSNSRTQDKSKNKGCPFCTNRKVFFGFNDMSTTHPELAKEANGWDPKKTLAGTSKKLNWKCFEGHEWRAAGDHRIRGSGCPSCATSGFDPYSDSYLYFLIQPQWEIYQIGITNVPEDRLNRHNKNGFELLEIRGPMDGHTAQELETALLRFLKSQKADLSPDHVAGKFDGYTESWTIDSYKVNNLKELIDKASEAGF